MVAVGGPTELSPSPPVGKELSSVSDVLTPDGGPKVENAPQLFSHRKTLLWCQYHSGVFAASVDPLCVKPIEIRDVERVEGELVFRGVDQVFLVGSFHQASGQCRGHAHIARTKGRDQIAVASSSM